MASDEKPGLSMLAGGETLEDWRSLALKLEAEIQKVMIGQGRAIRLMNIAIFVRGHVLLKFFASMQTPSFNAAHFSKSASVRSRAVLQRLTACSNRGLLRKPYAPMRSLKWTMTSWQQQLARETRLDYFRPDTPQQLGNWLAQPNFVNHTPADTDLRWLPGTLAVLSVLLACVTVPAFRAIRPARRGVTSANKR
jgi:hypothetical protein